MRLYGHWVYGFRVVGVWGYTVGGMVLGLLGYGVVRLGYGFEVVGLWGYTVEGMVLRLLGYGVVRFWSQVMGRGYAVAMLNKYQQRGLQPLSNHKQTKHLSLTP